MICVWSVYQKNVNNAQMPFMLLLQAENDGCWPDRLSSQTLECVTIFVKGYSNTFAKIQFYEWFKNKLKNICVSGAISIWSVRVERNDNDIRKCYKINHLI